MLILVLVFQSLSLSLLFGQGPIGFHYQMCHVLEFKVHKVIFLCCILDLILKQMLEGLVKSIAIDFDVRTIAKGAKASEEVKIAEVGADIELLINAA